MRENMAKRAGKKAAVERAGDDAGADPDVREAAPAKKSRETSAKTSKPVGSGASKASSKSKSAPASRTKGRVKAPASKMTTGSGPKAGTDEGQSGARPSDTQETIEALRRELAAARARIVELEKRQAEVIDRIDWVLDALRSATGGGQRDLDD